MSHRVTWTRAGRYDATRRGLLVYLARALATTGPARDGDTNTRADPDDVLIRHEARFMNILAVRSVFTSTQLCIARSAVRVSAALSILVRLAADRIVGMEQSASAMDADIPRRMDARDTSAALATLLRDAQRRSVEFPRRVAPDLRPNPLPFTPAGWAYHLVANACMTLAVKFQEPCDPTDPRPDAAATQRHVDVAFDRVCVQKMESLVLQELGWRLNPPTPAGIIPRLLILLGHDPSDDELADICARTDVYALAILYDVNFSAARATCVAGAIVAVVLEDREGYHRDEVIRAIVTAFDDPERIRTESIVACARLVDDFRAVLSSSSAGDAIAGE